jgi:glycosyltransferase involved in cell wall biosynthesis
VTDTPSRIAYLSLQAVEQGQDTWAAILEITSGFESEGCSVDHWFVEYPEGAPGVAGRLGAMMSLQGRLAARLSDYDLLYVRGHPFAFPIAWSAWRRGVPVVQECNGTYEDLFIAWPAATPLRGPICAAQRWQFKHADAVVTVTTELAAWIQAETGRPDAVVSPNAANMHVFSPDAPRREGLPARYVVFFGQFAPWQGISVILDATRSASWPDDVAVVFAGDGALGGQVGDAVDGRRVVSLGRVPYVEVAGVVAGSLASLVPTYDPNRSFGGFSPLKLYESMACGVPVIVSDSPGLPQIITEDDCGLVVPAGDAESLARAVAALAVDPERAQAMGRRARASALANHSWEARARQRLEVVRRAHSHG